MYWKHNNPTSPQIEAVLSKEDVTLHDLMEEDDILQECKSQNKKLIEFLVRPEVMEELVTLTTVEPSAELDEKARYKYSNIACELLTSDVPALNERLANDGTLLGKLYYFLESDPPLNPLLASYFSKTLSKLVSQRTEQDWYSYQVTCLQVLEFLKSKENFVSLLVKHLGTSAIMDLMLKLITNIEGVEIKQNILNWLDSEHIVQSLIALLNPSVDSDRQCNVAQLLSDIIARSRDTTLNSNERSNPDPIVATLESSDAITLLLDNILGSNRTETSIVGGIQVLLALLNFNRNNLTAESNYEQMEIAAEKEHREKVIQNVNVAIIGRLKDFHDILLNPPKKDPIQTTVGLLDPPFGNTRLQVTRLLAALLLCNCSEVKNELAKLGTIHVLLDLFFKYTWNNFLHTQVQYCIAYALIPVTKIEETNDNTMYEHIIVQCRLLGRILEAWDDNEQKQSQPKGVRQGYMGHLINIANNIAEQWNKTPLGEFITAKVNPETIESWTKFVEGPLQEINKKHQLVLGGVHPNDSLAADDNQDDYPNIPFPSDSALESYTDLSRLQASLQASTSQYIEVYGYKEDEEAQAEEIFNRVCFETRNFYDNSDDDDDLWEGQGTTTITSSKQRIGEWQRKNSDFDDPIANKLDETIVDPWKTEDSPIEHVAPIVESDPWSSSSEPEISKEQVDENWANFTKFDFNMAGKYDMFSNETSNAFCTPFDTASQNPLPPEVDSGIHSETNLIAEETPFNSNPINSNTEKESESGQIAENITKSLSSDNNANISEINNEIITSTADNKMTDNYNPYISKVSTDEIDISPSDTSSSNCQPIHCINITQANSVANAVEDDIPDSVSTLDLTAKEHLAASLNDSNTQLNERTVPENFVDITDLSAKMQELHLEPSIEPTTNSLESSTEPMTSEPMDTATSSSDSI